MEPTPSNSCSEDSYQYSADKASPYIISEQRIKEKRTQSQIALDQEADQQASFQQNILTTIVPRCIVDYDSNFRHIKNTLADTVTNQGRIIRKSLKLGGSCRTASWSLPRPAQKINTPIGTTETQYIARPKVDLDFGPILVEDIDYSQDCATISSQSRVPLHLNGNGASLKGSRSALHVDGHFLTKGTLPEESDNKNDTHYYLTYGKVKKVRDLKKDTVRKFKNSMKCKSPLATQSLSALDRQTIEKKMADLEAYDMVNAQNLADEIILDDSSLKSCCLTMFKLLAMIAITLLLVVCSAYLVTAINKTKNSSGNSPDTNNIFKYNADNLDFMDADLPFDRTSEGNISEELITEVEMLKPEEKNIVNHLEKLHETGQKIEIEELGLLDQILEMEEHKRSKGHSSKHGNNKKTTLKIISGKSDGNAHNDHKPLDGGLGGGIGGTFNHDKATDRSKREAIATSTTSSLEPLKVFPCTNSQFRTENGDCRPWLSCKEIREQITIDKSNLVGQGMTKMVYLAEYQGKSVAVSIRNKANKDRWVDFKDNIENLKAMQKSSEESDYEDGESNKGRVVTFLGSCGDKILVTEYHKRGTLKDLINSESYSEYSLSDRLNLLLEYVKSINFMHTFDANPHIYCDTHKLDGTTKQFLITDDDKLVMSDMDDIPEVKPGSKTLCKHPGFLYNRQDILEQDFIAPEQRLTKESANPPTFDHRTDIYKIADIAAHLLIGGSFENPTGNKVPAVNVKEQRPLKSDKVFKSAFEEQAWKLLYGAEYQLGELLKACRSENPERRPDNKSLIFAVKSAIIEISSERWRDSHLDRI